MDSGSPRRGRMRPSPRTLFSQRFAELFEAAGDPTLRRVAAAAAARMRGTRAAGQKGGASVQRISDWKTGRNVPAKFDALLPVLLTLIDEARKSTHPVPPALLDVQEWQRLWTASNQWDPDSEAADVLCPYLGLTAYTRDDADVFFGRARPTAELAGLVRATAGPEGDGGMVMLVGASGAGKSSLLQAGLIPALADPAGEWTVATMTPGADPVRALLAAIGAAGGARGGSTGGTEDTEPVAEAPNPVAVGNVDRVVEGNVDRVVEGSADRVVEGNVDPAAEGNADAVVVENVGPVVEGNADPAAEGNVDPVAVENAEAVGAALAAWGAGSRRLLVVDQLEELFTLCRDERRREIFLNALEHAAIRGETEPAAVLLAVRADFYARCLDEPVLEDALEHRSYLLRSMRLDELAEAISRPAEIAGYKLESGLEELIISELCGLGGEDRRSYDPGALPLVSHVMEAVWQRRDGSRLTIDGYREAGGVLGSVAATAEKAWGELTEFQQAVGKQVLLGLVAVGENSRDTRRKVSRTELLRQTVEAAEAALEALARTRLVTLDTDTAYLTHEIVLDAWPRLRSWIDEDRVGYLERQRLQSDATEWVEHRRDPSLLYRGARLVTMREHARHGVLGPVAQEFLSASESARRRARRRSRARSGALAVLAVVSLVLASVAFVQGHNASQQRDTAVLNSVLAEADRMESTDPSLSAQLTMVADRLRPDDPEVRARLVNTQSMPLASSLVGHDGVTYDVAVRPGGGLVASGSDDRTVRLWDLSDARNPRAIGPLLAGHTDFVQRVAFSPDGTLLASSGADNTVMLWDVRNPAEPARIGNPLPAGYGYVLAFGPDGRTLVTQGRNGPVTFWDISDRANPRQTGTPIPGSGGRIYNYVAVSRDLRRVVLSDSAGHVEVWQVDDPAGRAVVTGRIDESAVSATLSPDGATLALVSDGGVELWDIRVPGSPRRTANPMPDSPGTTGTPLAFSGDGRLLAAAGSQGQVMVWDVTDVTKPAPVSRPLTGAQGFIGALAFAPDGHSLAAAGRDGVVRLWSLPAVEPEHWPQGRVISARSDAVVVGDGGGRTVEIWRMAGPSAAERIGSIDLGPGADVQDAEISPDMRTLAVSSMRNASALFDVSGAPRNGGVPPHLADTGGSLGPGAFSADSRRMVVGGQEGAGNAWIQVLDLGDRSHPVPLSPRIPTGSGYVFDIRFRPDDRYLATAELDGSTHLWDMTNPAAPHQVSRVPSGQAESGARVRFSPDGRTLVTVGDDEMPRAWDVTDPRAPSPLADSTIAHDSAVTSVEFDTEGSRLVTADMDGAVRLWDLTDRRQLRTARHPILAAGSIRAGSVAFHPDGRHLIVQGPDGRISMPDLDANSAAARICDATRPTLTEEVWHDHLPGLDYRPPCE